MRILVDGIPQNLGGIGTLIMNIVNYNEDIGNSQIYEFEFLLPVGSKYINVFKEKSYVYHSVSKIYSYKYKKELNLIFSENKYDFLWVNNSSKINLYLLKIAQKHGTKIICHSHGVSTETMGLKKVILNFIEKICARKYCKLIDIAFACSKESAKYFYPKDMLNECKIVSNGIYAKNYLFDINKRNSIRNKLNLSSKSVLLGSVGRLSQVKNYEFLLNLMKELPNKFYLIILGEGEERKKLEYIIHNYGLNDRVNLIGKKDNVVDYLCAFDIFIMPSLHEGMPFSLIEAQANGLKCIVSSTISTETSITGNVKYLDLSIKSQWIEEIEKPLKNINMRICDNQIIIENGYSIDNSYNVFVNSINRVGRRNYGN